MASTSRFFAQKDIDTFDKLNKELVQKSKEENIKYLKSLKK